ncbi:hypothetical protein Deiofobo_0280 [Pseudomonas phage Deifobo]|nr:hypothetical protein Deiofobo_0280 [Pseudomonas phage Deifobo]
MSPVSIYNIVCIQHYLNRWYTRISTTGINVYSDSYVRIRINVHK